MSMVDALIRKPIWEQGGNTDGQGIGENESDQGLGINAAIGMHNAINSPIGAMAIGAVPGGGMLGGLGNMAANAVANNALSVNPTFTDTVASIFGGGGSINAINDVGLTDDDFSMDNGTAPPASSNQPGKPSVQTRSHDNRGSPRGESDNGGDDGDPGTGGNSGTGNDSGAGNGGASGPSGTGYYNGGMVTESSLRGPDPRGPDEGHIPIQAGEYVLDRNTVEKLGPERLKMLQAMMQ